MKSYLKTALVLTLICAIAAVLLAFVNKITKPAIEAYENSVITDALNEVASSMDCSEEIIVDDNSYVSSYYVLNNNGDIGGYILNLKTNGYGGEMTLLASYDLSGSIINVKMVSNNETPGVGKRSENEGYMDMFKGKGSMENPIPLSKGSVSEKDVKLVGGATITFTGISKALSAGSEFVQNKGGRK